MQLWHTIQIDLFILKWLAKLGYTGTPFVGLKQSSYYISQGSSRTGFGEHCEDLAANGAGYGLAKEHSIATG